MDDVLEMLPRHQVFKAIFYSVNEMKFDKNPKIFEKLV